VANVGNARLEVTADTSAATASFKSLAQVALKSLSGLKLDPTLDTAKVQANIRAGLKGVFAEVQVQLKLPTRAELKAAISGVSTTVEVQAKIKPPTKSEAAAALGAVSLTVPALVKLTAPKPTEVRAALSAVSGEVAARVKVKAPTSTELRAALSSLAGEVKVNLAIKPITQRQLDAAFSGIPAEKVIKAKLDPSAALAGINSLSTALGSLSTSFKGMFTVNVSALDALSKQIGTQIRQLTTLVTNLRALGGAGGGNAGAGGGSPGAGSNPYAGQFRALVADVKAGALGTAQFEQAVRGLLVPLNAEIAALQSLGVLTSAEQGRLNGLRGAAGQAQGALKGLADQTARLASASQTGGVAQIARDIESANRRFATGEIGLREYLRALQTAEAAGRTLAPTLAAGSKAANDLARNLANIGAGRSNVNTQGIQSIKLELAQARTAYEQTLAAAGNSWRAQGQAATAYQRVLAGVETQLGKISARANLSAADALKIANIQRQLASQQNGLQGTVSPLGISGAFLNALRQIPGLAQVAGGSLGAAAGQAGALAGAAEGIVGALGPVGVALLATVGLVALLAAGVGAAIGQFARFEEGLQGAKATLGLYGAAGQQLGVQLAALSQSNGILDLGVNSTQAASAIEELGSRGLSTAEILGGGLETATKLAAASGVKDLNVAAEALVGTMRAFGLEGKEAARVPDVLANAANVSALKLEDFRLAIAAGGSSARNAGINLIDFTATISLMRDRLIGASDAGTSFKSFVAALTPNSKEASAAMRSIGFSAFDAAGNFKDLRQIAEELAVGTNKLTTEQKALTLETIFGSDGIRTASTLLDNYNQVGADGVRALDARRTALEKQGTADQAAAERLNTLNEANRKFRDTLGVVAQQIGSIFAPALKDGFNAGTRFLRGLKDGGPVLDELKSYVYALAAAFIFLKAQIIGASVSGAWAALAARVGTLGGLGGIITTLGASLVTFGGRLASAASAGLAFGGLRGALSGIAGVLRSVAFAAGGIAGGLTIAIGAAVALAVSVNKLQGAIQATYAATDKADNETSANSLTRINALIAQNTELSRAKAKSLLITRQITEAETGTVIGTDLLGNRIYGPADEARLKRLQSDLKASQDNVRALATEDGIRAQAAKRAGETVNAALVLTKDQLKSQEAAVKSLRETLGQPIKVFGGTEFGNQLNEIAAKYKELRDKLREDVLNPKVRNDLSRQLTTRQGQETTQTRREFTAKADTSAADAERAATQAHIQAMAEGTARIRAQAAFDVAELRRQAGDKAKELADFPKQAAVIIAAGESQVLGVQAEASRKSAEFEKAEAARRATAERARLAAIKRAQQDVIAQQTLQRQLGILLTTVSARIEGGKFSGGNLSSFTQQLEALKARITQLPAPLQGVFSGLLAQAAALTTTGGKAAAYTAELGKLKTGVKDLSIEELQAARSRVVGDVGRSRSLELIDKEIARREKLIRTVAEQQLAEGRAQLRVGAGTAVITGFENAKAAVAGKSNEAQLLLGIELQLGAQVLAARQQVAQASAENDVLALRLKYGKAIAAAKGNAAEIARLEDQRDLLIGQRRAVRDAEQLKNRTDSDRALVTSGSAANAELLAAEGRRVTGQVALSSAEAQNVLDSYARRQAAANGNAQVLLSLERSLGAQVLAARIQQAQDSARTDIQGIREQYQTRIDLAGKGSAEEARLSAERDGLIEQRRAQRNTVFKSLADQAGQSDVAAAAAAARQIAQIETEAEAGRAALLAARNQLVADVYDREQVLAEGNIVEQLRIEEELGASLLAVRVQSSKDAADADVRQLQSSYQTRIDQAVIFGASTVALEAERDALITQRRTAQGRAEELLAAQSGQALIKARRAVTDALLQIDADLASARLARATTEAGRKKDQFERDLTNELSDLGNNERAKFELLDREQTARIALSNRAINAQSVADTAAENQRFAQIDRTGISALRSEELERDHQDRLRAITAAGTTAKANAQQDIERAALAQLGRANEQEVKRQVDSLTRNLGSMSAAQRESAKTSLNGWLKTFQDAGIAGEAAVKLIQDALTGVANADTDARTKAAALLDRDKNGKFVNPVSDQQAFTQRIGAIGKPDGQAAAVLKGSQQYQGEVDRLETKVREAGEALKNFTLAGKLGAADQQVFDLLTLFLPQWEAQLTSAQQIAADSGKAAGSAYLKQFTDLIVKPGDVASTTADFARKLGAVGKSDDAEGARSKAIGQFDSFKGIYEGAIKELNTKLEGLKRPDLTPDEAVQKRGLQATVDLYTGYLAQIVAEAGKAGDAAAVAFTQSGADKAQSGALALASARKELADANAESLPPELRPAALAAASQAYQLALTAYRDYWKGRQQVAQAGFDAGSVSQEELTAVNAAAAAAQKGLTAEIVSYGNAADATAAKVAAGTLKQTEAQKKTSEGLLSLQQARQAYDSVLGLSAPAYQSEIDSLQKLKLEHADLAGQIDQLIGKYKALQAARTGITAAGIAQDFRAGATGGQAQLQTSVSNVAKGLGELTSPMAILAKVLDKLNPVGLALEAMFSVLEEPLKALSGPFTELGILLGSQIAPYLELLAPILDVIIQVLTVFYDLISGIIKFLSFGFIDTSRRDPNKKKNDQTVTDQKAQNASDDTELAYRKGEINKKEYEARKFKLTQERLAREKAVEIEGAKGNAQIIQQINKKYVNLEEKERLDMLDRVNAAYTSLADNLSSSLSSGLNSSLLGALKAGNFGQFRTEYRKLLRENLFQAILGAAIEAAEFGAALQPAIDALKAALISTDPNDDQPAIDGVLKAGDKAISLAEGIYRKLKPLRDKLGIGAEGSGSQTIEVVGNISTPQVQISLDALALLGDIISRDIPPFREALLAHTPALIEHTKALPAFGVAVTSLTASAAVYQASAATISAATDRFAGTVARWDTSSSAHIGAMNSHSAALNSSASVGGGRKYDGGSP
jgi:TP901 family phage tail tape measure protein